MKYVKYLTLQGVDTNQVACMELQGAPNAATEGAVGALAMDMTSPTHDVYRCTAVNGSIYTWELLSAGMSIMSAKTTGEGVATATFFYSDLLMPSWYRHKIGDLILDSDGYLYTIRELKQDRCIADYTATYLGGNGGDNSNRLGIKDGKLQLLTASGNLLSEVDNLLADEETIERDTSNGKGSVIAIKTVNDIVLKIFVGTQTEYNALTDNQKQGLLKLITENIAEEDILGNINSRVKKTGDEMRGALILANGSGIKGTSDTQWLNYGFFDTNGKNRGNVMISNKNAIHFNVQETGATYADRYLLPEPTAGKTKDTWYNIYTSKDPIASPLKIKGEKTPSVNYYNSDTEVTGAILYNNTNRQFEFNSKAGNGTGNEYYKLPQTESDLSTIKNYSILTTKDFDTVPTENSTNPVQSGGVYTALKDITDRLDTLGFKQGTVSITHSSATTTTNYLRRQGNYVYGDLVIDYTKLSGGGVSLISSGVRIATLPLDFRPKSTQEYYVGCQLHDNTSVSYGIIRLKITSSGYVSVSELQNLYLREIHIHFGFDTTS